MIAVVPIIVKSPSIRTLSALLPITIPLLKSIAAPAPIAVAKVRFPTLRFAFAPMTVLLLPVVFEEPAPLPRKTLLPPEVFEKAALLPKNELFAPEVFDAPAKVPKNELPLEVFAKPAR